MQEKNSLSQWNNIKEDHHRVIINLMEQIIEIDNLIKESLEYALRDDLIAIESEIGNYLSLYPLLLVSMVMHVKSYDEFIRSQIMPAKIVYYGYITGDQYMEYIDSLLLKFREKND